MSFINILAGPECGVDIYEEPNEQTWVNCASARSFVSLCFAIPIIIIIVLLFIWLGSTNFKVGAVIIGTLLIGALLLAHVYWTPIAARTEFLTKQKEIKSRVDAGMSRAQAIQEIQKERLARESTAAMRSSASTNLAGMTAIARALRR